MSSHTPSLRLSLKALNRAAVAFVALLLVFGILVESLAVLLDDDWLLGLYPIVSLRHSQNLPQWSLMVFFASTGLLSGLLCAIDRAQGRPAVRWLGLAAVALAASLETFSGVSADVASLLRVILGPAALADLMLSHQVLASLVVSLAVALGGVLLVVGYRSLQAWWSLPPVSRRLLALGAAGLAVAPWIEARSFPFHSFGGLATDETLPMRLAVWFALAQSALKLLGATLLCRALIGLLAERGGSIRVAFAGAPGAGESVEADLRGAPELTVAAS